MHNTAPSTCCYLWMQFNSYHIFVAMQTNKNKNLAPQTKQSEKPTNCSFKNH